MDSNKFPDILYKKGLFRKKNKGNFCYFVSELHQANAIAPQPAAVYVTDIFRSDKLC